MNKSNKLLYYSAGITRLLIPDNFFRAKLSHIVDTLSEAEADYVLGRVNYYNKITKYFDIDEEAVTVGGFKFEGRGTYYLDTKQVIRYFDSNLKFSYIFGDVTTVPDMPAFVKSRPLIGSNGVEDNGNSVLLKLNKVRHFNFLHDRLAFDKKQDMTVWRGRCFNKARQSIVRELYDKPRLDIGQTDEKKKHQPDYKPFMSIADQLRYKFVLSLEGKDVATNLKWIMSSNSLCFMPKPRFETWFMEGCLTPSVHYVQLKDDCSDIEEKMDYYLTHMDEALEIINNAHRHVAQFKNKQRERLISFLVAKKYFEDSGQL